MKFGPIPTKNAEGAVLAHSLKAGAKTYRKGHLLNREDLSLIGKHHREIIVASLETGDVWENDAAARLADALAGSNIRVTEAFTGRVNLIANRSGILKIDADVRNLNAVNEAISLATLPDFSRVAEGQMVGTVKIITYAVPTAHLAQAIDAASSKLSIHPFAVSSASLILTETATLKKSLTQKAEVVLKNRLSPLQVEEIDVQVVPHEVDATTNAIERAKGGIVLLLGGSATSDRRDVCPAALVSAGGSLKRFGMPVDPGNLLFLGEHNGRQVVGLPGCVRSPALNGADWVLERLIAGLEVTSDDIAAMGEGGLLKEIPSRPQPRLRK